MSAAQGELPGEIDSLQGKLTALVVVLCAGLVLALYFGALHFPLVFDDEPLLAAAAAGPPFAPRWLSSLSFALGGELRLQRLVNVLLHAAAAAATYALCRELVGRWLPAAAAAGLFLVHPAAVYGVAYLAQRSIVMATLFSALALYAWLRAMRDEDWRWLAAAVACYALAVLSKEHAVMLPAVCAALALADRSAICARRGGTPGWAAQVSAALAAMAAVALWTAWSLRPVVGAVYEPQLADLPAADVAAGDGLYLRSVLTQAGLFFRYLATWCWPAADWMAVDLRVGLVASPLEPGAIAGAAAFIAWGCAGAWLIAARRAELLGFAMLAPWLLYLTEFAAVRMQEPLVLYRSYLWFGLGLPPIAAGMLYAMSGRTALVVALCAGFVLAGIARGRIETFSSPAALWDDAVRKLPAQAVFLSERPYINRGVALMREGRLAEARADFDQAIGVNPRGPVAWFNRSMLNAHAGELAAARVDLAEAQRLQRATR